MLDQLNQLEKESIAALEAVNSSATLAEWDKRYLGKKGALTQLLRSVGQLPKEERPAFGQAANRVKVALEAAYEAKVELLQRQEMAQELERGALDVTLPGRPPLVLDHLAFGYHVDIVGNFRYLTHIM